MIISGFSSANSIGEYSFVFETDIQNITQFLIDAADPTDDPAWIEEIKEVLLSLKNWMKIHHSLWFIGSFRKSKSTERKKIWILFFVEDGLETSLENLDGEFNNSQP